MTATLWVKTSPRGDHFFLIFAELISFYLKCHFARKFNILETFSHLSWSLLTMDNSADSPNRETFQKWLTSNFLSNNRTKTIAAEKYDKICRYILGDNRSTNAKFRYWVRTKGFFLARLCHSDFGHSFQGYELMIKPHPEKQVSHVIRKWKYFPSELWIRYFQMTATPLFNSFYMVRSSSYHTLGPLLPPCTQVAC